MLSTTLWKHCTLYLSITIQFSFIFIVENSQISGDYYLNIYSEDSHVAVVDEEVLLQNASYEGFYTGYFTITGNFLGAYLPLRRCSFLDL